MSDHDYSTTSGILCAFQFVGYIIVCYLLDPEYLLAPAKTYVKILQFVPPRYAARYCFNVLLCDTEYTSFNGSSIYQGKDFYFELEGKS